MAFASATEVIKGKKGALFKSPFHFVEKLKKRFGEFADEQIRFEKASNSEIARELGYSDAQFSRLIQNRPRRENTKRLFRT